MFSFMGECANYSRSTGLSLALLLLLNLSNSVFAQTTAVLPGSKPKAQAVVLSPQKFKLPTRLGYQAAQANPGLMKELFCYCGCDRTDNHSCLLDCFTSIHGAYCAICQEEAIESANCKAHLMPLAKIQSQIDGHYAKRYPFPRPSERLLQYRKRLKSQVHSHNKVTEKMAMCPSTKSACCH